MGRHTRAGGYPMIEYNNTYHVSLDTRLRGYDELDLRLIFLSYIILNNLLKLFGNIIAF